MNFADRALYRVWQFWNGLGARPLTPEDMAAVASMLNSRELALFNRLTVGDQKHSYRVMRLLRQAGQHDRNLVKAALLHDVGKTFADNNWWDRIVVVLGQWLAPNRAARWSLGECSGWSRAFVVKSRHAEWGADAAATAGSSATTVALIRWHHHPPDARSDSEIDQLLALLQWADDRS